MFEASKYLDDRFGDAYTTGRHLAISSLFVNHLTVPVRETIMPLYSAIDDSLVCGDKHLMLSCVGSLATIKLLSGDSISEVEAYCSTGPEEFGDWTKDLRSGTWLMGCR